MLIQTYKKTNTLSREMADGMLIQLILAGEQNAFETLVSRYQKPLFTFLCHFLHNTEMASDILQDVFIKLYISLPILRTDQPLKGWLFQVARNCSRDELRHKHPISFSQLETTEEEDDFSLVGNVPDSGPLPEEIVEKREIQQIVYKAINKLPLKFRQVVLLRYVGQLRFSEISTLLDMPQSTAKTYFQRARPLLRRALSSFRGPDICSSLPLDRNSRIKRKASTEIVHE